MILPPLKPNQNLYKTAVNQVKYAVMETIHYTNNTQGRIDKLIIRYPRPESNDRSNDEELAGLEMWNADGSITPILTMNTSETKARSNIWIKNKFTINGGEVLGTWVRDAIKQKWKSPMCNRIVLEEEVEQTPLK